MQRHGQACQVQAVKVGVRALHFQQPVSNATTPIAVRWQWLQSLHCSDLGEAHHLSQSKHISQALPRLPLARDSAMVLLYGKAGELYRTAGCLLLARDVAHVSPQARRNSKEVLRRILLFLSPSVGTEMDGKLKGMNLLTNSDLICPFCSRVKSQPVTDS